MQKPRLNNLHILGIYCAIALAYTLYYLPFLPEIIFNYTLFYGLAFIAPFVINFI